MMLAEPGMTINGQRLTSSQAMLMRAALEDFAASLDDGLGDDDHGKRMTALYRERVEEIRKLMGVGT